MPLLLPVAKNNYVAKRLTSLKDEGTTDPRGTDFKSVSDAQYIDSRDGKKKSGKTLSSQKTTRSRENLPENLRQYRKLKLKKGHRAIRKQRYPFQPGDLVILEGKILMVKGTMSNGRSVLFTNGKSKTPKKLTHLCYGKGSCSRKTVRARLISQS